MDDRLNKLFKQYNLVFDKANPKDSDVFVSNHYKIIARSGVEKIEAALKINVSYEVAYKDEFEVSLLTTATSNTGKTVRTFGEASTDRVILLNKSASKTENGVTVSRSEPESFTVKKGNVKQNPPYLWAMAEKRGKSRAVLMLADLYQEGFYGEDEADDFGKAIREERKSSSKPSNIEVSRIKG